MPQPATTTTERERDPNFGTRVASTRPGLTDDGSFEVVVATETPCGCEVFIPELGGWIWVDERLDVSGMRQEDIDGFVGCPLLDTHQRWSAEDILGVVDAAWREGTTLLARVRVSSTETEIRTKLRERIITRVSAGYGRRDGATIEMRSGDVPLLTQPFTPREVSLVAIPADPNAHIRTLQALAARSAPEEPNMTTNTTVIPNLDGIRTAVSALVAALGAAPAAPAPAAPATDVVDAAAAAAIEGRQALVATIAAPAAPAAPTVPAAAGARSAADETAIAALRTIATLHGRAAEFEVFVKTGESVDGLRTLARSWSATNATEINGAAPAGGRTEGQRSFVDFDAAIAAQTKR